MNKEGGSLAVNTDGNRGSAKGAKRLTFMDVDLFMQGIRGETNMGKILKKIAAAAVAAALFAGGILSSAQPARAAVKAWERRDGIYYNSAGKVVPNVLAKGMDVSQWQGDINWDKVAASGQIDFAMVRVAHGGGMDKKYVRNLSEAARVGIPVGVYFYSLAKTEAQSRKDAQVTLNAIKGYKVSYPVVIDIEDASQHSLTTARRTKIVQAFADEVLAAGYQPMIYCNTDWAKHYINMSSLKGVDAWIAEWGPNPTLGISRDIWQVTDQGKVSGISGYVDLDYAYKKYAKNPAPKTGWEKSAKGYRYKLSTGKYVQNKFKKIDGKTYYFDRDGYRATDFKTIEGKTYYFGKNGVMRTGMKSINGAKYYFESNGVMVKGAWKKPKKNWYYLTKKGKAKTGWLTLKGVKYYLNSEGVMQKGWQKIGGKWYYFKSSGAMVKQKWVQSQGIWYFLQANGQMQTSSWLKWKGAWYFLKKNGQMKTGWMNWKGKRYYLKTDGSMRVGWLKYKGKYYYFDESGAMLRGTTQVIDGKSYKFNQNGVWVK